MARPRKDQDGVPARERLEEAFWEMLTEMPYSQITIKGLSARAQINHNTFYYYYDNLDDLADKLFDKNMLHEFCKKLTIAFQSPEPDPEVLKLDDVQVDRMNKTRLLARSQSPTLIGLLVSAIKDTWYQETQLDEDRLTDEELFDIEFFIGGELALLRQDRIELTGESLILLAERPLGKAIYKTLSELFKKYGITRQQHDCEKDA
ncbi:MAG: TetR/AcrR family transcriptional regulator [Eggerthellaceae bacterium]|jgi:AcrR family transcriptional regulator